MAAAFCAPPEAGNLNAELWYYGDQSGTQQGPFDTSNMREWFDAGFLPPDTLVAASYYGEIPDEMWPIKEVRTSHCPD